jgi:lysyl-tRNA synthetase class 2
VSSSPNSGLAKRASRRAHASLNLLSPDSELKKRQKQREKEAAKAEKAKTQAQQPEQKKKEAKVEEEELDPTQYFALRTKRIQALRASQNPDPYPHKFNVSQSVPSFIEEWSVEGKVNKGDRLKEPTISLAGRLGNMRSSGQNLHFYDLHAEGEKIQILAQVQ